MRTDAAPIAHDVVEGVVVDLGVIACRVGATALVVLGLRAVKLAATRALAALTKEDVPDSVRRIYPNERLAFGPDYIIPKPFDPRVLVWEASAVARAAMETGVAQEPVDIVQYREQLEKRLGKAHEIMRVVIHKAQAAPKRVVFPEGENEKILRAGHLLVEEKIAKPILLGNENTIPTADTTTVTSTPPQDVVGTLGRPISGQPSSRIIEAIGMMMKK